MKRTKPPMAPGRGMVKVSNLKPNPFKKNLVFDQHRVEALKRSIEQTGFWNNLLARKVSGKYQLAYGHHRVEALRQLGVEYIEIMVKDIDDTAMIQIMAADAIMEGADDYNFYWAVEAAVEFLGLSLDWDNSNSVGAGISEIERLFGVGAYSRRKIRWALKKL